MEEAGHALPAAALRVIERAVAESGSRNGKEGEAT